MIVRVPSVMIEGHSYCPANDWRSFKIQKASGHLHAIATFLPPGGPSVLILLGSGKEFDVECDAFETNRPHDFSVDDFKSLRQHFEPKKPGTRVILDDHRVQVNAEPQIRVPWASKYFHSGYSN